jgi:hypothetical protein
MTPPAHILYLDDLKSFSLPLGPLFGNIRRPQLPAKHDGASFVLCVDVTNLESQLAGVA